MHEKAVFRASGGQKCGIAACSVQPGQEIATRWVESVGGVIRMLLTRPGRWAMLSTRLVELIESYSDQIAKKLLDQVKHERAAVEVQPGSQLRAAQSLSRADKLDTSGTCPFWWMHQRNDASGSLSSE